MTLLQAFLLKVTLNNEVGRTAPLRHFYMFTFPERNLLLSRKEKSIS